MMKLKYAYKEDSLAFRVATIFNINDKEIIT